MSQLNVTSLKHEGASGDNITLSSNGSVGIGTSSPSQQLHVNGVDNKILIESADYAALQLKSGSVRTFNLQSINDGSGALRIYDVTAGTERMRIDSAGRVTMPYQPAFAVKEDGSSSYTGGQYAKLDSIQINVGNCYNQSTGLFTAPVAGNYLITSQLMTTAGTGRAIYYIYKNGSAYMESSASSTDYNDAQATVIMNLQVNDTVGLLVISGTYYPTCNNQNWFCGHLIG